VPAAPPAPPAFQEPGDADGAPTHAEITRRAYEIFVKRGGRPGDPMKDWLDAEAELKAERRKGPTSRA
jgi:hypothetical protein